MKTIVFGATGSIGRLAVQKLLQDGHEVTAFSRSAPDQTHPKLTHIKGDAFDEVAVANAIKGHDGVVITLGAGMNRKSKIRSVGTLNVIRGMHQHGVRRLICQSTLGTAESWQNLNFYWKRIMFGAIIRPIFKDHELQEQLVKASGLDWTIVRPSAFTDAPAGGDFITDVPKEARNLALKISRGDVAQFIGDQIASLRYVGRAVGLST